MRVTRRASFSAAHKLQCDHLSEDDNKRLFGKCYNLHGHNYDLYVSVEGDVDPQTGLVVNFDDLKAIINRIVMARMDHKYLNEDVPELKNCNPTAENIARVIWKWLVVELPTLVEVKLVESENNIVTLTP